MCMNAKECVQHPYITFAGLSQEQLSFLALQILPYIYLKNKIKQFKFVSRIKLAKRHSNQISLELMNWMVCR